MTSASFASVSVKYRYDSDAAVSYSWTSSRAPLFFIESFF